MHSSKIVSELVLPLCTIKPGIDSKHFSKIVILIWSIQSILITTKSPKLSRTPTTIGFASMNSKELLLTLPKRSSLDTSSLSSTLIFWLINLLSSFWREKKQTCTRNYWSGKEENLWKKKNTSILTFFFSFFSLLFETSFHFSYFILQISFFSSSFKTSILFYSSS